MNNSNLKDKQAHYASKEWSDRNDEPASPAPAQAHTLSVCDSHWFAGSHCVTICDEDGMVVATNIRKRFAEDIVRAVNSQADLLAALEMAEHDRRSNHWRSETSQAIRAAIARAKGVQS